MINYNIPAMSLSEHDEGEIYLPSETFPITFDGNLRQFLNLTRRAYNPDALELLADKEELKIEYNDGAEPYPYWGINLTIHPNSGTVDEFVDNYGDDFFDSLKEILSYNTKRRVSGKRAIFVGSFEKITQHGFECLQSHILVSTSIFYNDFRITTGYPAGEDQLTKAANSVWKRLSDQWGSELEIALHAVGEIDFDEDDDDFHFHL